MLRSSIPTTIEIKQFINSAGTVLADPTQINQVIMNLCINAYHAMRESGGILSVSLSEIELQEEDAGYGPLLPGSYLKLEVSDTGCGIAPELLDRIYEPYFTTKKTGEGTGLGLAVVHGVVNSHNGHVAVYSEPGQGTSFHVYLPLVKKEALPLRDEEVIEDLAGAGERVLFIDDEVQISEIVSRHLSNNGYQVTAYTNAVQALEHFQKEPDRFDLIITDMTMPYMTGSDFAQKVLGIRPAIPIILCTGQSDLINRKKANSIGICDYLKKPVLKHDLLLAAKKALQKRRRQP
jgi:CheY-like chemotaxis protein